MEIYSTDHEYHGETSVNVAENSIQRQNINVDDISLRSAHIASTSAGNALSNAGCTTRNEINHNSNIESCTRCTGEALLNGGNTNVSSGRLETNINLLPSSGRSSSNTRRTNGGRMTNEEHREEIDGRLCMNSGSNGRRQRRG